METPSTPLAVVSPLPRGGMRYLTAEARRKGKESLAEAIKASAQAKMALAGVQMAKVEASAADKQAIAEAPADTPVDRTEAINTLSWAIRAAQKAGDYRSIAALVKELRDYQGYALVESDDTMDKLAAKLDGLRAPEPEGE